MIRLANYAKPYLGHIVITILASIGCSIANVWIIDILKQVIDESVKGTIGAILPELIVKVILIIIIGMSANYFVRYITGVFGAGIFRDLRRDLVNHIIKMAPDFMERNNFGDIVERVSSDVEGIAAYMQNYFKRLFVNVPIMVAVFTVYLFSLKSIACHSMSWSICCFGST